MSFNSHHNFDNAADAVELGKGKSVTATFDDIDTTPYGFAVIQNGYSKLDWSSFYVLNSEASGVGTYGNSGYFTGITSGDQVAYNPYFATSSSVFLSSGTFTFDSVQMTSAWNKKETVEIQGFDKNGNMIQDTTVTINDKKPTDVELHWKGVSNVTFVFNDNGKQDPKLTGSGNNVVFDDMVFSSIKGKAAAPFADHHTAINSGIAHGHVDAHLPVQTDLHQPIHAIA